MRKVLAFCSVFVLCALGLLFLSQRGATAQDKTQAPASAKPETVAKPKTEKQKKKDEEKLKKELETPYKKWLNEDVIYIISDEERKAFGRLNTDEWAVAMPSRRVDGRRFSRPRPPGLL